MEFVSRSAVGRHEPGHLDTLPSDEPERPIGPARGIFYAVLFGAGMWLMVLGAVEGVRHLLHL